MKKVFKISHQQIKSMFLFCLVLFISGLGNIYAQNNISITGKVTDSKGEGLPFVNIVVKGQTQGSFTEDNGSFTISVPNKNAVLQFSFVGFVTKDVTVGEQTNINVVLESDANKLDEVIVVAYGTMKKSSVTGAISVLKSDKLNTVTSPNVNAMLQGKIPGVQVLSTSGRPGEAAQIRIRGKSTLNNGSVDPLWVIDGIVGGTGAQLNPNEIESMSVLKDGSATALYGSRAANGVILVTTKGGKAGANKIDVSVKLGVANMSLGKFKLMNSQELYDYSNSIENIENYIGSWLSDDVLKHNTNWFDIATQSALSQNYTISHSSGTEKLRSFLSGDYYTEEGTIKGFTYNRFNIRSNIDYKFNDRLTIKTRIAGSYWNDNNKQRSLALTNLPWDYPYNEDGTIRTGKEIGVGNMWMGRDNSNYLYNNALNWARGKQLGVNGTFGFEYKILDYLTFESSNNIGFRYHLTESYTDPRAIGASEYNGSLSNSNSFTTTKYANQLLRFNKLFNDVHNISSFLGYEYSDYLYESNGATGRGLPIGKEILDVTSSAYNVSGTKSDWAMQSVYFNTNYTYDNRYDAQFSFRTDGSSKFGKDNRYGFFFTVGGGWNAHNELFMKDVKFVDQLRLRASYGSIGNMPSAGYAHLTTYNVKNDYVGVPAAFPGVLGNPRLTWEKCFETNIGLDSRLFDRVNIIVDYYLKNTSDLLYWVPFSSVSGYPGQYQNIGAIKNQGIEITINPEIIKTKDLKWNLSFNLGYNKSKIKELNQGKPFNDGNLRYEEGISVGEFYMAKWAGVDTDTGKPMWYKLDGDGNEVLTFSYDDAVKTRQLVGNSIPTLSGGIMTDVSYKGFTLSAACSFVSGNKIYHGARELYDNDGAYYTFNSMVLKDGWSRWEKPGDIASHPKPMALGNGNAHKVSSRYIENGAYFRLDNITLSYQIPSFLIEKIGFKYADISVSGENLLTVTQFSGIDPAVAASSANADTGVYPSVRRFSVGIKFSF